MPEVAVYAPGTPMWVDLGTPDLAGSTQFYSKLFGWDADEPVAEAGGYTLLRQNGKVVAGIGPIMMEGQPTAWSTYVCTEDADETAAKVQAAGGKVIAPPMQVMNQGKMAVFQDPTGAYIGVWQPQDMQGAEPVNEPNSLCWNELDTRDLASAKEFYAKVFGWNAKTADGTIPYTEWHLGDRSIGGAMDITGRMPDEVPANWLTYFAVDDCEATCATAKQLGGAVMMEPMDIDPGRFAVIADPQGGVFAVIKLSGRM